ncbi:hypothetical protein pv_315 [Pithovirus sibericum]|uniref:Uncharacterized protein n=1 Tax=Pithovirus sibericum TaxID=1450746 RepID=W5S6B9_9VIRU|nr:hypothetical protein pv_315 [Pithovirus sibericum]AHH01882.1 hypothetical protein pv_315 [Pithovirus sibericum]
MAKPVNLQFHRAYPVIEAIPKVVLPPIEKEEPIQHKFFQPQPLWLKSLFLLKSEQFLESLSELSLPEIDWETWSKLSQHHFDVPVEYFNLAHPEVCGKLGYKKRNISGKQRYIEIASSFDLLFHDRFDEGSLFEPSSALVEALERNDVEAVDYFFSKLPQQIVLKFKEKVFNGEYEPEKGKFQSLAYQRLVFLLFGRTEQVLLPSEAELAVEKGNSEFFSFLFNSKQVSGHILEMVSRGNSEAFLLLEKGLKNSTEEEYLRAILRSGNQIFLERFLALRYPSKATRLIKKLREISIPFDPYFKCEKYKRRRRREERIISPIDDFDQTLVVDAMEGSNPLFIEFLSHHGKRKDLFHITSNYYNEPEDEDGFETNRVISEIFRKFSSWKTQSRINPVGLYQIAQRIDFGALKIVDEPTSVIGSIRNNIDLLIYIYYQIPKYDREHFIKEVLFKSGVKNLEICRYFMRLKPSVISSIECEKFLQESAILFPSTCKLISEFRNHPRNFPERRDRLGKFRGWFVAV